MRRSHNQKKCATGAGNIYTLTPCNNRTDSNRNIAFQPNASVTPSPNNNTGANRHRFHQNQYNSSSKSSENANNVATSNIHNPYKRKTVASHSSINNTARQSHGRLHNQSNSSYQRNPHGSSVAATAESSNSSPSVWKRKEQLRTQHPHRAGRIRVDRQFASGISIGDHLEERESDGGNATPPLSRTSLSYPEDDQLGISSDGTGSYSTSAKNIGKDCNRDEEDGANISGDADGLNTICTNADSLGSSDDDDDDVLMFIPFKHEESE